MPIDFAFETLSRRSRSADVPGCPKTPGDDGVSESAGDGERSRPRVGLELGDPIIILGDGGLGDDNMSLGEADDEASSAKLTGENGLLRVPRMSPTSPASCSGSCRTPAPVP